MDLKGEITRRTFLQKSALAGAAAKVVGGLAPATAPGANDTLRVGVMGTGERGQYLMSLFRDAPGAEIVGVCDVYAPRRAEALKIAGERAQSHIDYRELLDRKDVDAVVISAPDHWHKQMLLDALSAGKDAYLEKPIMHSIAEGLEMVRAVAGSQRVVQTGTQQRNWDHWILGKQIVDSGKLGKITFIHTYWYQNYLQDLKVLPEVDLGLLDWKRFLGNAPEQPFTLEKFYWWRWFWDFGGGILTDLLTHWIDVIQWYMHQPVPSTATTTGDVYRMNWQAPDTLTAAYEYPGDFMVTFTGAINGGVDDGGIEFRGSEATLKIDRSHLAVYPEGQPWAPGTNAPEPEILVRSERDGTIDNVKNFLDCVRSRKTPNAGIQAGFEAARASWIGNLALKVGRKIAWDATKNQAVS